MADAYKQTVGGRLKIGGKEVEIKRKKKKRKLQQGDASKGVAVGGGGGAEEEEEEEEPVMEVKTGTGRITSSGPIVTGYDTRFSSELKVNDALIITHPTTLAEETRIIKMIVSDKGMAISSAFSTDLISTTSYRYIHPPSTEGEVQEDPEETRRKKKEGEVEQAFGTYGSSSKVVYRVKKAGVYGGYKIMTEEGEGQLSRTELLERRSQHKSDRHAC